MCEEIFEEKNDSVRENFEKFYLDSKTADLSFIFGADTEHFESVPAHRIILSVSSPVFETMFYGSLKEKAKIPIVDATAEAFKEFLQLFYLTTVRLTGENIIEVSNLCKKYEVNGGIKICESPLKRSLTFNINEVCSGYEVALLLELENVIKFCEQNIKDNALEILQTSSFLECDAKLFDKILRLVSARCCASIVVDTCIAWAKAECKKEKLRETTKNLRAQVDHSFQWIPFDKLKPEQFSQFVQTYKGFLKNEDLHQIILKMMAKNSPTKNLQNKTNENVGEMICDRRIVGSSIEGYARFNSPVLSHFTSNSKLLLTGFYCARLEPSDFSQYMGINCRAAFVIGQNVPLITLDISLSSTEEAHIILKKPIIIDPNIEYGIFVEPNNGIESIRWARISLSSIVRLENNTEINFSSEFGLITRLNLQRPDV